MLERAYYTIEELSGRLKKYYGDPVSPKDLMHHAILHQIGVYISPRTMVGPDCYASITDLELEKLDHGPNVISDVNERAPSDFERISTSTIRDLDRVYGFYDAIGPNGSPATGCVNGLWSNDVLKASTIRLHSQSGNREWPFYVALKDLYILSEDALIIENYLEAKKAKTQEYGRQIMKSINDKSEDENALKKAQEDLSLVHNRKQELVIENIRLNKLVSSLEKFKAEFKEPVLIQNTEKQEIDFDNYAHYLPVKGKSMNVLSRAFQDLPTKFEHYLMVSPPKNKIKEWLGESYSCNTREQDTFADILLQNFLRSK